MKAVAMMDVLDAIDRVCGRPGPDVIEPDVIPPPVLFTAQRAIGTSMLALVPPVHQCPSVLAALEGAVQAGMALGIELAERDRGD